MHINIRLIVSPPPPPALRSDLIDADRENGFKVKCPSGQLTDARDNDDLF